jgi:predicted deacylase
VSCGLLTVACVNDGDANRSNDVVDLHTASFGRVNSFYVRADMNDPMTRRMAFLQHPQIIVQCVSALSCRKETAPLSYFVPTTSNTGPDGSLRGAAAQLGINAITVEIGNPHTFQLRYLASLALFRAAHGFTVLHVRGWWWATDISRARWSAWTTFWASLT